MSLAAEDGEIVTRPDRRPGRPPRIGVGVLRVLRGTWHPGVALVWGAVLVLSLPMIAILAQATRPTDGLWAHLAATVLADYVVNSLALAALVGGATAVTGTATAWIVTMYDFPGRRWLAWGLVLPLALPGYVLAYAYTDLLQFAGPVQSVLRETFGWGRADYWFPAIHSVGGAAFVLSCALYPYVYVTARAAFLQQSVCVLEVSRTLGLGPWQSFRRVALPLARPGIAAGVAFAVMETLADFGAVKYFDVPTFTTGIYRAWFAESSPAAAAQLGLALLGFVVFVLCLERISRGSARVAATSQRDRQITPKPLPLRAGLLCTAICAIPVLVGFVAPVAGLLALAVEARDPAPLPWLLTLAGHTVLLASAGALLVVAIALLVLYGVRHDRSRSAQWSIRVLGLGYAIPGAVLAVGILVVVGGVDRLAREQLGPALGLPIGLLLGGTMVAVLYGYLIRFFSVGYHPIEAGFAKIRPNLEAAARVLGAGPSAVLRRVHLPLLRASVVSAALLVFVDVMKELPLTMILRPFNLDTLATETFRMATTERLDDAAAPALLIVLAGLPLVLLVCRQLGRERR